MARPVLHKQHSQTSTSISSSISALTNTHVRYAPDASNTYSQDGPSSRRGETRETLSLSSTTCSLTRTFATDIMSEPAPPHLKIDLLLSMANDLAARYSALEELVATKMDVISTVPKTSTRRLVRDEEPSQDHHDDDDQRDEDRHGNDSLALVKCLLNLLDQIGKDTRALQSSTNAIAAQIHNISNNSADKKGDDPGDQGQRQDQASRAVNEPWAGLDSPCEDAPMMDGQHHIGDFLSEDVTMANSSSEAEAIGQLLQDVSVAGEGNGKIGGATTASNTTFQQLDRNMDDGIESTCSSDTTTTPDASVSAPLTTTSAQSRTSPSNITLSAADMGDRLIPALEKLVKRNETVKTFSVPRVNITLPQLQASIDVDDEAWQFTSIVYESGGKEDGYARVCISKRRSDFDWSVFANKVQRPTVEEAKAVFEQAVRHPPAGDIPYLVGHASIPQYIPLNPGPSILEDADLIDLHTEYQHIGAHLSANRIHCEDMTAVDKTSTSLSYHGFRSYNEVYFGPGYKLWLLIAMHHTAKFHDLADASWTSNKCSQRLGHQCLLVAPSRLEKEGIDFRIEVVGRGEAIVTEPGELHAIVNYGACAARSMNYLLPADRLVTGDLTYCSSCGLTSVYEKHGATLVGPPKPWSSRGMLTVSEKPRKRKAVEEMPTKNPETTSETTSETASKKASKTTSNMTAKTTRTSTALTRRLDELEEHIRELDPLCRIPDISRHDPGQMQLDVLTMAASIRSSAAVEQFINLVRDWRRRDVHVVVSEDAGDVL